MHLAISRFTVANGMQQQVRQAFSERPHRVDESPGFVRMEVAQPTSDDSEFWLMTWWTDKESFHSWHHGHSYHESHLGIPKGLRLDPKRTSMVHLDVVAT